MKLNELRQIIREEISKARLNEESNHFNGKNLDFYKENFKLLKTKNTPKTTVYIFELPQEINDKVINDNPAYGKIYKNQNYFTISVPKIMNKDKKEELYKPYGLYLPQNDALENYINTL